MRRRASSYVLVLAVLGAPLLAAAVPHGKLVAKPARARTLAVRAAGIEVALDHMPRRQAPVRHVARHVAPAQRPASHVTHARPAAQLVAHRVSTSRSSRTLTHDLVLAWPAQGVITTPFVPSGPSEHDGIDIGSLRSLTVVAAHGGRVIHVGYTSGFEGYGQIVDVEVAPGIETLYAHLAAMDVRIGQVVHPGETIGTAGCTGKCYGTHLHFEVRVNNTPVNPIPLLGG